MLQLCILGTRKEKGIRKEELGNRLANLQIRQRNKKGGGAALGAELGAVGTVGWAGYGVFDPFIGIAWVFFWGRAVCLFVVRVR